MTNLPLDTEEQVLEATIGGLSRVAEAILATPNEARTKALDAAEDSYHRAARDLGYDEAKIEEWVSVMFRLRAEISAQELAQQQNEPKDDAPSLMPASASQNVFRLE
jgi:hypothetical protein